MIAAAPQTAPTPTPTPTPKPNLLGTNGLKGSDFMTLLISQLKNQDPTSPMDPTQFVTQLVQFNSLEQLININQDLTPATPTPGTTTGNPPPAKS